MNRAAVSPIPTGGVVASPIPARAGIGLRFPHHDTVLSQGSRAEWFEVHPENYLGRGVAAETLQAVREQSLLSLHATGLSLGSVDGVDKEHLAALADLCYRIEPGLVSDHFSWSAASGLVLPDLFPLPHTSEALEVFVRNVDQVQSALCRSILIENPSVYFAFADSEMGEAEFLAQLVSRTGCGVLLDINNIAVSAANLGERASARLDAMLSAIPASAIGEIHLAGHAVSRLQSGAELRIDDHGSPVSAEVWSLFTHAIGRIGARPTLIEWDTNIPPFEILQGEAEKANLIIDTSFSSEAGRVALG